MPILLADRHHFSRRQIFTKGIDDLWKADLVDMQSLALHNDGVQYIFTCIDTFSKYAWARPLKNKSDGIQDKIIYIGKRR